MGVGLSGCRTIGPSDYRAVGLSGRRNIRRSPPSSPAPLPPPLLPTSALLNLYVPSSIYTGYTHDVALQIVSLTFILRSTERGGGGVNFHYKGIYRCAAGRGILFRLQSIWMHGYHFHIKSIKWGIFFTQKVYEWVKFEKLYMNGYNFRYGIEVYDWFCFLTSLCIWMGWGPGTPVARPYPK